MDVNPTAVLLLLSLVFFFLQSPKPNHPIGSACSRLPWPAVLPHRPHRPTLLHCWPGHSSTHPHLLLFSGDGSRTSKPSYSPPHGQPLPSLPWLRVVPFLGFAVVHCHGALGAALSTWSMDDIHRTWTVHGKAGSWVHGRTQGSASILRAKKMIRPLTAGTHQLHLRMQGSA